MTANNSTREGLACRPSNAKKFPGAKIGDFLYSIGNCLMAGVARDIVVGILPDDFVLVAEVFKKNEQLDRRQSVVRYGCNFHYASLAECLKSTAEDDINYHQPRLDYAKKVLRAVREGDDLTQFIEGPGEPD